MEVASRGTGTGSICRVRAVRKDGLRARAGRRRMAAEASAAYWGTALAAGGGLFGAILGVMRLRDEQERKTGPPRIVYNHRANRDVRDGLFEAVPSLGRSYAPPLLGANAHAHTILPSLLRPAPDVAYDRECVLLDECGGTLCLDWMDDAGSGALPRAAGDGRGGGAPLLPPLGASAPLLLLKPGLTGGSDDAYVSHMALRARLAGWRVVCFNSRGCGDGPVTTPQFYSASYTEDTRRVVRHIRARYPEAEMVAAMGWSLGANILVNYLGEDGEKCGIDAAMSLCNPFNLEVSDRQFDKPFNRAVYNRSLARNLGKIYGKHKRLFEDAAHAGDTRFDLDLAAHAKSIRDFDEAITRRSFGFSSVDEYYKYSGSCHRLPKVTIPLLCIQAEDDPIAPDRAVPYEAIRESPHAILAVSKAGGHLGWCVRDAPGGSSCRSAPWPDDICVEWLAFQRSRVQSKRAVVTSAGALEAAAISARRGDFAEGGYLAQPKRAEPSGDYSGSSDFSASARGERSFAARTESPSTSIATSKSPSRSSTGTVPVANVGVKLSAAPLGIRLGAFLLAVAALWAPQQLLLAPLAKALNNQPFFGFHSAAALYVAILAALHAWGRGIRGLRSPLSYYMGGLTSSEAATPLLVSFCVGSGVVALLYNTLAGMGLVIFHKAALWTALNDPAVIIASIACGLGVATVEELVFRGYFLDEFARKSSRGFSQPDLSITARAASSTAFALCHARPASFPGLFALGFALCGLRNLDVGLAPPIGFHAGLVAANFFVVTRDVVSLASPYVEFMTGVYGDPLSGFAGVFLCACAVLCVRLFETDLEQY